MQIENYSIYLKDNILFSLETMASDPKPQEWWSITGPVQEPLPSRKYGEWWATMDEVFHLD